jgi:site-specific recombinase XerD
MPRVFTQKVVIPGDKIHEYLDCLEKAQAEREPFVKKCQGLAKEFFNYLLTEKGLTKRTANQHYQVIQLFNDFLESHTDVQDYAEVTKGIANSYFKRWYKSKVWGGPDVDKVSVSIKKFFLFLKEKKGIHNQKVLGK